MQTFPRFISSEKSFRLCLFAESPIRQVSFSLTAVAFSQSGPLPVVPFHHPVSSARIMHVRYATGWRSVLSVWNGAKIVGTCTTRYVNVIRNMEIPVRKSRLLCPLLSECILLTTRLPDIVKYTMAARFLKVVPTIIKNAPTVISNDAG